MAARTKKMPGLIIFADRQRVHVAEAVEEFTRFVKNKATILANCFQRLCEAEVLKEADFAVVFGGDGTILSAARYLSRTKVPVIGVNVGKLGFLAEFRVEELERLFERIITDRSLIEKRMILRCGVRSNGLERFCETAINDVVINSGPPFSLIELKIRLSGQSLASCVSDGLIICTPTGSTAYNLSAGGPILSANISAIVITPLCPHSLSFRPIVIGAESSIEVEILRANEGTAAVLDGKSSSKLKVGDVVKVAKDEGSFLVVNNPTRTQWDTLANKLSWAEKPRYTSGGGDKK